MSFGWMLFFTRLLFCSSQTKAKFDETNSNAIKPRKFKTITTMKNPMKKTLQVAALAGLALVAVNSAQATYNQGDLLVGFTSGSGNDLVYDLGSISSLTSGEQWDLGGLLVGNLSNLANDSWGVIGVTSGGYNSGTSGYYATSVNDLTTSLDPSSHTAWIVAIGDIGQIGLNNILSGNYGTYPAVDPNNPISWSAQTLNPNNNWAADFFNPNATGVGAVNFYQAQESGVTQDSYFGLGATGVLQFGVVPVPEPSPYYLVSGGGLLLLAFRRRFARNA